MNQVRNFIIIKLVESKSLINNNVIDYNTLEKIDEETYNKMCGKFYDLIISSYASKGIQKALKSTISSVLTKIFEEVYIFLTIDPRLNSLPLS